MRDNKTEVPADFWRGYAIMATINIVSGFLCLTSLPRAAGKKFLELLHKATQSASISFEFQCLAATIAIMVGADSGFRAIICRAMDALRAIPLNAVTWDEFKENSPNPACYEKSRSASFKEIDYFISHSWSDDPEAKWEAVQAMRAEFKEKHGREPLVWFDKYCIDQNAIDQSVRPIFVVAADLPCPPP